MYDVILTTSYFNAIKISEPLGICYLAAYLRKYKISVKIVDPSIEGLTAEETADTIIQLKPKVIGISIHRDKNISNTLQFLQRIAKSDYNGFLCAGGHGPSIGVYDKDVIEKYIQIGKLIDAFVIGESERAFYCLVSKIINNIDWKQEKNIVYLENGKFIYNNTIDKEKNLDNLPFMARDVLSELNAKYKFVQPSSISFGRGCYYQKCTYCSVSKFENLQAGKAHRQRSIDNIISEIIMLHEKYGVTHFNFEDDNVIIKNKSGIDKIFELCDKIDSLPFKITFTIFTRVDAVSEKLFSRMKTVGLNGIYLGVESVTQSDLDFFSKGITAKAITDCLDILYGLGFSGAIEAKNRIMIGYITWHPLSSLNQLQQSLLFFKKYNLPQKLIRRSLRLYSGTYIKKQIKDLNLLNNSIRRGWDFKEKEIDISQSMVTRFVDELNKSIRDKIRSIEKAVVATKINDLDISKLRVARIFFDKNCFDFFYESLLLYERHCDNVKLMQEEHYKLYENKKEAIEYYIKKNNINNIINFSLKSLNMNKNTYDLFRK